LGGLEQLYGTPFSKSKRRLFRISKRGSKITTSKQKRNLFNLLEFLGNDEVLRILTQRGIDKKEIKTLLK